MLDNKLQHSRSHLPVGKTTVVITAHNYGRYVAQCIDSVLEQSRPPAQVVVVDDASEDDTAAILSSYIPKIECHRVEFKSAQRARNFGLRLATTEYVLFLDADDYLAPMAIEKFEEALDREPAAHLAYCDKNVFGSEAAMERLRLEPIWRAPDFSLATLRFRNFIMLTSLVRRARAGTFDERIHRLQDWDFWLSMLSTDSEAIHVPEALLHYRVHGENLSIRQYELIERLKILVKHGLIGTAQPGTDSPHSRKVAILTCSPEGSDLSRWRDLARRLGWRVRAVSGSLAAGSGAPLADSAVVRAGPAVLQTVPCVNLEDLLWRFAGVIADDRIDAIIVAPDLRRVSRELAPFARNEAVLCFDRTLDDLLSAKSLEDLGTFALSPAAVRQLLYLSPAARPTPFGQLRRAATELASQHIAWRFHRDAPTNSHQDN